MYSSLMIALKVSKIYPIKQRHEHYSFYLLALLMIWTPEHILKVKQWGISPTCRCLTTRRGQELLTSQGLPCTMWLRIQYQQCLSMRTCVMDHSSRFYTLQFEGFLGQAWHMAYFNYSNVFASSPTFWAHVIKHITLPCPLIFLIITTKTKLYKINLYAKKNEYLI